MADNNKYHNNHFNSNGFQPNGHSSALNGHVPIEEKEDEIDLKQLFYTLWNRKWLVIGSVVLFGVIAGIIAVASTPVYESNGSLLISEPKSSGLSGTGSDLSSLLSSSYGLGVGSTLANELQVLRSRKLSNAVADTLMQERLMPNGRQFPVLFRAYPDDSTMTTQDTVAARIRDNIVFSQVNPDAKVVSIIYDSPSPYETAHVVNMAMMKYKSLSKHQNRSSASSAVGFLEQERGRIKSNLHEAEEKLRTFMNNSKLVQVDTQTEELIQQMATMEADREEARAKLVAAKAGIQEYQSRLNDIKPGLAEQYSEAIGPNITKLQYAKSELELEKQQLLAKNPGLNDSSPQLNNINRKISDYKDKIRNLTQNLINKNEQYLGFLGNGDGVAKNISDMNQKLIEMQVQKQQFQSQVDVIGTRLKDQQRFFDNLPDNMVDLARLKRDVTINEELYKTVSRQYAETALWEQTQFGLGRVIDTGFVPINPVSPRKKLYVLIGFILGGMFSVSYIFVSESFNNTIDGVEKLRSFSEPVLSVIPDLEQHVEDSNTVTVQDKELSANMVTILKSISPVSEAYRRLESNIIYSNPDTQLKSIMVTSSGKGEGKTTTTANLGVILAEAGYKTIIVDTDLRRPNLHNMFGTSRSPGIAGVLFDDLTLQEAVQETIVPGLNILPVGRKVPNPSAIIQSRAFLDLIAGLEGTFDVVLIDTPPFGIIADSSALVQQTDGIIVAVRFNKTSAPQLAQTLEQLHRIHAHVFGTVLTAFDHTKSNDVHYGSSYYREVYKEYAEYEEQD